MITIRLLGPPALERDGEPARPPRGRKAWALLCYLVLAERPPARRQLAELLFADADDPLGALRWTLAELRRALRLSDVLGGDPVSTALPPQVQVDVAALDSDAGDLRALRGELLAGVELPANLEFESWLLVARHRVSAAIEARLRQTAVELLSTGRVTEAIGYASLAVERNPMEESNHELLVRGFAAAGQRAAALRQVAVCEDILRRELGVEASPALREAAEVETGSAVGLPLSGRAAAASQLEAGRAAIGAGAVEAGMQTLRRAVVEAGRSGDRQLHARALAALGQALVHAVRGRDAEGSVVLHEAIELATLEGDRATAVSAYRVLGFVEVQAGRRRTADRWLAKAQELAETDQELAAILGVRGMNASDTGDYPGAFAILDESVTRAARAGDQRQQAWSLSIAGRAHLLRGERSQAVAATRRSLDLVREQRWMAFLPWPQSLQAELDLDTGDVDGAADGFEQAWTLGCQLGDVCWQGMAARGIGLVHARRGDHPAARDWFDQAAARSISMPDRYQWVYGYALDASIADAIDRGDHARARPMVEALSALAARCEMRELVVRAYLHRCRLGDPAALVSARHLGADIDNPALEDLLRTP